MELKKYADIAYDQFGGLALELVPHFQDFNMTLNKANIKLSLPEYIALSIGFVVTTTIFVFTLFGTLFVLSSGLSGLLSAFIITLFVGMFATGLTYFFPVLKVTNRASVIRDMLPFATMYLSTLAGTGSSIAEMFENLSKVDEYGEVSEEAAKILKKRDIVGVRKYKGEIPKDGQLALAKHPQLKDFAYIREIGGIPTFKVLFGTPGKSIR